MLGVKDATPVTNGRLHSKSDALASIWWGDSVEGDGEKKCILQSLALAGNLEEYLIAYRLFSSPHPEPSLLLEHLTICYNRWDLSLIDFTHDVDSYLPHLARDPSVESSLVELIIATYYLHIRVKLDGRERAIEKLNALLDPTDKTTLPRHSILVGWMLPVALLGACIIAKLVIPNS